MSAPGTKGGFAAAQHIVRFLGSCRRGHHAPPTTCDHIDHSSPLWVCRRATSFICYHSGMDDSATPPTEPSSGMPDQSAAGGSMRGHAMPPGDLPATAYTLSLTQVSERFVEANIGRSRRRLAELCQNGTLDAKKLHTTSGPTWFVTEASVAAAIQQITSDEALAAAASGSMLERAPAGGRMPGHARPQGEHASPLSSGWCCLI